MKEFWDSILNNMKNRVGTPFLSAFLFSFIVIHQKLFYIALFFGNETIKIDGKEYSNSYDFIRTLKYDDWDNYFCPLIIGFVYALFIPLITNVSKYWDRRVSSAFYKTFLRLIGKYPKPEDIKKAKEDYDTANKDLVEKQKYIYELRTELEAVNSKVKELEETIVNKNGEITYLKRDSENNEPDYVVVGKSEEEEKFEKLYNEIIGSKENRKEFRNIIDKISQNKVLSKGSLVIKLKRLEAFNILWESDKEIKAELRRAKRN